MVLWMLFPPSAENMGGETAMTITVAQVVAHVESGSALRAVRYEPAFERKLRVQVETDPSVAEAFRRMRAYFCRTNEVSYISEATAYMLCATSWGKYQILGWNLWTVPLLDVPLSAWLEDEGAQEVSMDAWDAVRLHVGVRRLFDSLSDAELQKLALRHNGNLNYVTKLKRAYGYLRSRIQ